ASRGSPASSNRQPSASSPWILSRSVAVTTCILGLWPPHYRKSRKGFSRRKFRPRKSRDERRRLGTSLAGPAPVGEDPEGGGGEAQRGDESGRRALVPGALFGGLRGLRVCDREVLRQLAQRLEVLAFDDGARRAPFVSERRLALLVEGGEPGRPDGGSLQ